MAEMRALLMYSRHSYVRGRNFRFTNYWRLSLDTRRGKIRSHHPQMQRNWDLFLGITKKTDEKCCAKSVWIISNEHHHIVHQFTVSNNDRLPLSIYFRVKLSQSDRNRRLLTSRDDKRPSIARYTHACDFVIRVRNSYLFESYLSMRPK